jgi:hypothetical protein
MADFKGQYAINDPGHREEHFIKVEEAGLRITKRLKSDAWWDEDLVILFAWLHDLFSWSRINHHQMSAFWVRTTNYKHVAFLSDNVRELLARACEEHRASYKGGYSSLFSQAMAAADRGIPDMGKIEEMVERSIQYHMAGMGGEVVSSSVEARKIAIAHVKHKYGSNGYARWPDLTKELFGEELKDLQHAIDNF